VVNRELQILAWNGRAEDLWGVSESEVTGEHLPNLDIGLPVDQLRGLLRSCLSGETDSEHVVLSAVNRRGKTFGCDVTCSPLLRVTDGPRGAILVMEEHNDGRSRTPAGHAPRR
jgi:two-component system, chemotaxis family, CheB/CheR fusion protein